ncbi:uncharacterized protein NEPG_01452 [Nematocida parisii ERTm1]|uniref:Uncharacterized protein n=1 Tax=Nematocida parisii (strain ERTm3) TaxID=935791 RepID=I3EFQ7_NEMP3|nr:uncharacterized protein NEPG_01452 [Nematocida parisii ERTm1]EIJ88054.1 hypothetical protein NEQG_01498 [Nematocida parisii ERTm3]EIJ93880.1 hypothetical protein NEPG_01452 [Nematocida parisii ERTm1]KAI5144509.1 hypothetical protein NEPAR07_1103 [Nematocida parisii]|eukprot:XP_013059280.1 hypothetical protein NEPG_01452 [Nematocida parisii ERTm1]
MKKIQGVSKQKAQNNKNEYLRPNANMHTNKQCIDNGIGNKFEIGPRFNNEIQKNDNIRSEDSVSKTSEIQFTLDYLRFMCNQRIYIIPITFNWVILMYLTSMFFLFIENLELMNNPNQAENIIILLIFKSCSSTAQKFLIVFIAFFFVNIIYAACRIVEQFNAMRPTLPHMIINNKTTRIVVFFIEYIMMNFAPMVIGKFISSKYSTSLPITPMVYIFYVIHMIYFLGEFMYHNTIRLPKYYIFKPNTKQMKIAQYAIYYINHVILVLILMAVAISPDVLVPLTVIDYIYKKQAI